MNEFGEPDFGSNSGIILISVGAISKFCEISMAIQKISLYHSGIDIYLNFHTENF